MAPTRRTHRKSRLGCLGCKKRRIKCDEQRPVCKNCFRHDIDCEYATEPPLRAPLEKSDSLQESHSSVIPSPPESASSYEPEPFKDNELVQIRLMHNFITSTCQTFTSTREVLSVWRHHIPKIAFEHPFLLQMMLAVSALHTYREDPPGGQSNLAHARRIYFMSLEQSSLALSQVSSANCEALYAFPLLALLFELGTLHTRTSLILRSDGSLADWILHTRGIRTVMGSSWHDLVSGMLKPMLRCSFRKNSKSEIEAHLDDFMSYIQGEGSISAARIYLQTVCELKEQAKLVGHGFYSWLCHFSDEYGECLARKDPYALIIFGYACVNLQYEEPAYWVRGCAERLMRETYEYLNTSMRVWLHWPMQELGLTW